VHTDNGIGLILIDIDGTLVGPGAVIHDRVGPAMERARERGVHLALCTGRPCSGTAVEYARRVSPDTPHIFQSGATVCHLDGSIVASTPFPAESYGTQVALARRVHAIGAGFEVYTATDCYVENHTQWTLAHEREIGLATKVIGDLETLGGYDDPVIRVQWIVMWEDWPPIEVHVRSDAALELSVASHPDLASTCFSSVTARGISKASAGEQLAAYHGLTLAQTAMVGDGDNDIAVLSAVGLPIAMGNASPGAKAVASRVVGDVSDGGLADAIDLALSWS
jgi:Cof subfamily protein (haloacid dehalogenase superfamily)